MEFWLKIARTLCSTVLLLLWPPSAFGDPSQQEGQNKNPSQRRALLVGISIYAPARPEERPPLRPKKAPGSRVSRFAAADVVREFGNLRGPSNDVDLVQEILRAKYGFTDIRVLRDQSATRDAIIEAIQSYLIDAAAPGDTCVLYYSGHGSRVRNSKDPKGYDESIVPADTRLGASDIRDKELARLFLRAIEKGVHLTAIFDSCHSGSIARGLPRVEQRARSIPFDKRDVAENVDFIESPEDKGALVLSAVKDEQLAYEDYYGNRVHGNFTWALATVLKEPTVYASESASRLFDRVVSMMKSRGLSERPVLGGTLERRRGPLFGHSKDQPAGAPTAAVVKVHGDMVILKGGLAMGLNKGCELTQLEPQAGQKPIRLRVTRVSGLDSCHADIIDGQDSGRHIASGMLFIIDRWTVPHRLNLKVYIPPPVSPAELARVKRDIAALRQASRFHLVPDPTKQTVINVLQYGRKGWSLTKRNGAIEHLGTWPGAEVISGKLSPGGALFINLPPTRDLRQRLKLGKGTRRELIGISETAADVQYVLTGRVANNEVEYAWVRPGITEDTVKEDGALPARTDWLSLGATSVSVGSCAERLGELAVNLGKISGWLQIQAPTDEYVFPYKLALRRVGDGLQVKTDQGYEETRCAELPEAPAEMTPIREGKVFQSECYDLVMVGDQRTLQETMIRNRRVKRRWIYVFSIDSEGRSTLLFPTRGVVENYLPFDPVDPQAVITLNRPNARVWYQEPFGLDIYILLASDEELTNPDVLEFGGAISRGKGGNSALANLIDDIRTGTRGPRTGEMPLNWSIDRVFIRSTGSPSYRTRKPKSMTQ